MTQVKILVQGYLDNESGGRTSPNVVLIEDERDKILVDPGSTKNQKVILDALKKNGLTPQDITYVALTHSHFDHFANIGMFGDKKIIEFYGLWDGGKCSDWPKFKNIKIIKTPGHSYNSLTFLVSGCHPEELCDEGSQKDRSRNKFGMTENEILRSAQNDNQVSQNDKKIHNSSFIIHNSKIAICGDVWWKENYPKKDPYASDLVELEKSRKKVLALADFIIQGHGKIFKTKN